MMDVTQGVQFIGAHVGAPYTDDPGPAVEVVISHDGITYICTIDERTIDEDREFDLLVEVVQHCVDAGCIERDYFGTKVFDIPVGTMNDAITKVRDALQTEYQLRPTEYWYAVGATRFSITEEPDGTSGGPNYTISCLNRHVEENVIRQDGYLDWLIWSVCTRARKTTDRNGFVVFEVRLLADARTDVVNSLSRLLVQFPLGELIA